MLQAIHERAEGLLARGAGAFAPVAARLAPSIAVIGDVYSVVLPYVTKIFHYGFVPFVLLLGMRTEPRPALTDLISPIG